MSDEIIGALVLLCAIVFGLLFGAWMGKETK